MEEISPGLTRVRIILNELIAMNQQSNLKTLATLEALRHRLLDLEASITSLLEMMRPMPEGELRDKTFEKINALDLASDSRKLERHLAALKAEQKALPIRRYFALLLIRRS